MRITADSKKKVRERILESARQLFVERGFAETTTRDLAIEVGIAAGTLFNYFPTKEAIATELIAEGLDQALEEFEVARHTTQSAAEELFLLIATGLRHLERYRRFVAPILELVMNPFTSQAGHGADRIRTDQLIAVAGVVNRRLGHNDPSFLSMHVYWSLYVGVLSFWSRDESPHQEDTLALLDHSTRLFVASLQPELSPTEMTHGA